MYLDKTFGCFGRFFSKNSKEDEINAKLEYKSRIFLNIHVHPGADLTGRCGLVSGFVTQKITCILIDVQENLFP